MPLDHQGALSGVTDRFWQRVPNRPDDGCWEWEGKRKKGYGLLSVNGRRLYAHRISAAMHFGMFDQRMFVCHACDNPACVRPSHLFLGDARSNALDRNKKGRAWYSGMTRCRNGHDKAGPGRCRECSLAAKARYRAREKEAAHATHA